MRLSIDFGSFTCRTVLRPLAMKGTIVERSLGEIPVMTVNETYWLGEISIPDASRSSITDRRLLRSKKTAEDTTAGTTLSQRVRMRGRG